MKIGEWFLHKQCDLYRTIRATEYTDNDIWNATNIAFKSLENAEKYRWHDLRKDPNDLPETNGRYSDRVIIIQEGHRTIHFIGAYDHECRKWRNYEYFDSPFWCKNVVDLHPVIAWKYIEPCEGEEE